MKFLMMLVLSMSCLNLLAAAPKVVCESMSYEVQNDGSTVPGTTVHSGLITVVEGGSSVEVGKAIMETSLRRICASDGGPCSNGYELMVSLKMGDSEANTGATVSEKTPKNTRQHLNLQVGNHSVFVNCDKE